MGERQGGGSDDWVVAYYRRWPHERGLERVSESPGLEAVLLSPDAPAEETDRLLARAKIYVVSATYQELPERLRADAKLLAQAPDLLAVLSQGAGMDTIDLDACEKGGVLVCNQAGCNAEAVAEHAIGMMLVLSKRITDSDRAMRTEAKLDRLKYMGRDLKGRTVGIIGLGATGGRLAELGKAAFSMRVLAYDPFIEDGRFRALGVERAEKLDDLLPEVEFLAVCCSLNATSFGMMGADQFALMRPEAYLVTTARGGVVDEDMLEAALESRLIAGAGVDVWSEEPPPVDHKLLRRNNVVASPHIAGVTIDARLSMGLSLAEQCIALRIGCRPERLVNPGIWPQFERRARAFL